MKRSRGQDEFEIEPAPKRLERELRSLVIDPEVQTLRDEEQAEGPEIEDGPTFIIDPRYLKIPSFVLNERAPGEQVGDAPGTLGGQLVVYRPATGGEIGTGESDNGDNEDNGDGEDDQMHLSD